MTTKGTCFNSKHTYTPPIYATIQGRREPIFRGTVTRTSKPGQVFVTFTIETALHRIVFGLLDPAPGDLGLTPASIKRLTMGRGEVSFANGSTYRKPVYRTISCDELTANERLANALELQRHTADGNAAKLNARLDTVLKLSHMDGKPSRGQLLVDEVRKRHRDGMTPIDVCRIIARDSFAEACKTGASRWMSKATALAANKACLRGDKPTKQDFERLAQTLKRERNRALKVPNRTK